MTESRTAAIYCRVSTLAAGKKRDPWHSLSRQRLALTELAARLGWQVVAAYEEQISGAKAVRPMHDEMIARVRAGEIGAVLVVDFTRLTRTESMGEWEKVKDELRTVGCVIATTTRIYTLTGEEEELETDILAAVSKYERRKIMKRTIDARVASAKEGRFTGHPCPFGYTRLFRADTGKRYFEVNPEQAEVVMHIFRLYLQKNGSTEIAKRLNEEGIPGPTEGIPWRRNSVKQVLGNAKYAGLNSYRLGAILVPSKSFPAIIPMTVWEEVNRQKAERTVHHRQGPGIQHPLSGLLRCPGCGKSMGWKHGTSGTKVYAGSYVCQTHDMSPGRCPAPAFYSASATHATVLAYLREALPAYLEEATRKRLKARPKKSAAATHEEATLNAQALELERRREIILNKIVDGTIEQEDADFTLRSLRKQLGDIGASIKRVSSQGEQADTQAASTERLRPLVKVLKSLTPDSGDEALRRIFEDTLREVHVEKLGRDPLNGRRFLYRVVSVVLTDESEHQYSV